MSVEIQTMGEGGIFEIAAVVIDEVLEIQPFTDVEYEILSSARDILAEGSILEAATVATNSANTAAGLASEAASAANDAAGLANSATTSANTAAGLASEAASAANDAAGLANSATTSANTAAGAANTAASSANSAASAANTAAATAASFVGTGPAGYYATLTALQAAYPTGDTGIYVELEYGHWYYWSGSAWIDGGLFQAPLAVVQTTGTSETDVMSQKAVTDEIAQLAGDVNVLESNKVSVNPGKNLFDPLAASMGFYLYYENSSYGRGANSSYFHTDYIPIDANGLYSNKVVGGSPTAHHLYYDANKAIIGRTREKIIPYIENAAYVRCTYFTSSLAGLQIEKGSVETTYEVFSPISGYPSKLPDVIPSNSIPGDSIKDGELTRLKTDFITQGNNLFNKDTVTLNAYIQGVSGDVITGQSGWWCTDFIEVKANTTYSGTTIRDRAFYGADKTYISGSSSQVISVTTPPDAAYIRFSTYNNIPVQTYMFNEGDTILPFEPYYLSLKYAQPDTVKVILPDKIYAIVGDTLQLFYRGIIKAWNPYQYDIAINCSKGAWFPRYFEYTPVIGDVGTTTLEIKVKDNNGKLLGSKTCQLITRAAAQSPSANLKTLFIGDSLTNAGIYTQESFRRLTGTGGTPIGKEFTNIQFVGRKPYGSIFAEGNSGWSWGSYLTVGRKAITFTITEPSIMPTVGAVYKDVNNKQYTMWWDYSTTSVKMLVNDMVSTPPASGTLTKVSGTGDATITYSASVQSSGNPFWNDGTGALDFTSYVDKWLDGSVDVIYTLLTWNAQSGNRADFTTEVNYAKTLFAHIHNNYPDVKIKLMGVQVSDLRGGVRVDGTPTENTYTDTYGLMVTALNMNKAYQDLANDPAFSSYVEFVGVSSQVDSEYNMPYTEKAVNTRFDGVTEKIGTNDVHPNTAGYNQIADIVYRNFVANFCQ